MTINPDPIHFETPAGERLVILTRDAFNELIDRLDAAEAALLNGELRAGRGETFSPDEAKAYVVAASPLAFWRARRGLSQAALARQARLSPSYVSELDSGRRQGSPAALLRLARVLRLPMEALVDDEEATPEESTDLGEY